MSRELEECRQLARYYLPECPEADDLAVGIMRYVNRWIQEQVEDAEAERQDAHDQAVGI